MQTSLMDWRCFSPNASSRIVTNPRPTVPSDHDSVVNVCGLRKPSGGLQATNPPDTWGSDGTNSLMSSNESVNFPERHNVQSSGGVSSLQEICWTNPSHHDTEEPPSSDGMPLTTPDRSCKLVARWSAPSEVACLPTHAPAQPRGGWTEDVFRGESFHMEWCHISHRCDNQPSLDVVARDQNLECGLHGIVICTVICIYT